MTDVYRKRGRVAHLEHGRVVVASEAGEAVERGSLFAVTPLREPVELPLIDVSGIESVGHAIQTAIPAPLQIERLVVSHGVAEHEYGGRRWREESKRIHLSIAHPNGVRALVDRGDFQLEEIRTIAAAMSRHGSERAAPQSIRLAANVTAAVIPLVVEMPHHDVELWQSAGGLDGKGNAIEECRITAPPWPNWYRPSYRVRPVRVPLHLRLRFEQHVIDPELPVAIALLAPVTGPMIRVLVCDGESSYPCTLMLSRIRGVSTGAAWYPYGAGVFGVEVML